MSFHLNKPEIKIHNFLTVSHTTEDLKFEWEEETPLVVDAIQLPQLQLVKNKTSDCTQIYSTGML